MSKQKISLTHLSQPAKSLDSDSLLLGTTTPTQQAPADLMLEETKVRFTNALPPATFQRLQQYSFWAHETIGDVLDDALKAYFVSRPEADKPLPDKQAAKKRRVR